jgi:hypothetical protein
MGSPTVTAVPTMVSGGQIPGRPVSVGSMSVGSSMGNTGIAARRATNAVGSFVKLRRAGRPTVANR